MHAPNWNDDDELMREIGLALPRYEVGEQALKAARAAFAWRSFHADLELATLVYDSYVDDRALVRGPSEVSYRTLRFTSVDRAVEIELTDTGIEGQLIPPEPGRITMFAVDGPRASTTADDVGCFRFPAPPRGPMRLECAIDAGTFLTEWTTV